MRSLLQHATHYILIGFIALLLTACATKVEKNSFPELTFDHVEKINLDVAEIQIKKAYQSPMEAPYVDHEMPANLMKTTVQWATDVFQAKGNSGVAVITISEASVIENVLEKKEGITGTFTTDQSERYSSKLSVEIKVTDQSGASATTSGSVMRSVTVPEDIKYVDREKKWFSLVEKSISDLDVKLHENANNFLSSYLAK